MIMTPAQGRYRKIIKTLLVMMPLHLSSFCASCSQTVGDRPQSSEDVFLPEGDGVRVETWIENLQIPWSLVFLPDELHYARDDG